MPTSCDPLTQDIQLQSNDHIHVRGTTQLTEFEGSEDQ
jgi:hypothetical protein